MYNGWKQETVEVLLRHQADVNARDKNWQTPLHVAAANNAVKCAEFIIPLLSNVNVSDRSGRTSLHHAAFNGHLEVSCSLQLQNSCWGEAHPDIYNNLFFMYSVLESIAVKVSSLNITSGSLSSSFSLYHSLY